MRLELVDAIGYQFGVHVRIHVFLEQFFCHSHRQCDYFITHFPDSRFPFVGDFRLGDLFFPGDLGADGFQLGLGFFVGLLDSFVDNGLGFSTGIADLGFIVDKAFIFSAVSRALAALSRSDAILLRRSSRTLSSGL